MVTPALCHRTRSELTDVKMAIKNFLFWILCLLFFLVHSGTEPLAVASRYARVGFDQPDIRQSLLLVQPARYRERFRNRAQRKRTVKPAPKKTAQPANELTQLKDSYIKT